MRKIGSIVSIIMMLTLACACSEKGAPAPKASDQAPTQVAVTAPPPATSQPAAGGEAPAGAAPGAVVASIDGSPITESQLDEAAEGELQQLAMKIYQIKKRVLDGMIEKQLIEKAAAKKGMTADAYVAEEVDNKVKTPSEKEIKEFYEKRKEQIQQPFEAVKDKIAEHLKMMNVQTHKQEVMAKLKKDANVQILIQPPRVEVALEDDIIIVGNKDAKVLMIEFSDFQCPYSGRVQGTVKDVLDKYEGKIRYAFLDFPLPFHKDAPKAHEAAHCAGEQGKYKEYKDKLFDNQKKISVDDLKGYAKDLGLNTDQFNQCLDSDKYDSKVKRLSQKGRGAGVSGTPAFFINGIMISGAQPQEAFEEVIESELSR